MLCLALLSAACASDRPAGDAADVANNAGPAAGEAVVRPGTVSSADGLTIAYDVRGAGEPTLILIHGWMNPRGIWGEHPNTLARTHRVVTVDLAGHGESDSDRADWTIGAFGDDVAAVVEALALEDVVLVGFSMGGAVALEATRRLDDRVRGVVFIDTLKDPEALPPPGTAAAMEERFRESWGDTTFLRAFGFTPDAPDSLVQFAASTLPPEPHDHWFVIARSLMDWLRADFTSTLRDLNVPVAAINTTAQPTNVAAIRRLAPSFTFDTIAGVGHAGILLQRVADFDARLRAIVDRFPPG